MLAVTSQTVRLVANCSVNKTCATVFYPNCGSRFFSLQQDAAVLTRSRCDRFALQQTDGYFGAADVITAIRDDAKPLHWVLQICSVLTIHLTLGFPCISLQNSVSAPLRILSAIPARYQSPVAICHIFTSQLVTK
jgi:hypothetical protein